MRKIRKGIVGIQKEWEAEVAYARGLELSELKAAIKKMNIPATDDELDELFLRNCVTSARRWRNEIVHNFGPSNVSNVVKHSVKLNRRMHDFLENCTPAVLRYLKANYEHLRPNAQLN